MTHCISFPPISTPKSRVLILGSMPGVKSLELQQYYAHPQNAFWKIMAALFDADISTYAQKVKLIKDHDLALWDVMKFCIREGSLDSNIEPNSVETNDFKKFLKKHPLVTNVFLNGGTAAQEFKKRVWPILSSELHERITLHPLPSTSPAHAGMTFKSKLEKWQGIKIVMA